MADSDPFVLINAALDRVRELQAELPCRENLQTITHLQQALGWQEARAEARSTQGVKGSDIPHEGPCDFLCAKCGARVTIHVH